MREQRTALLLIDFVHILVADGGSKLPGAAVAAAQNAASLKEGAKKEHRNWGFELGNLKI